MSLFGLVWQYTSVQTKYDKIFSRSHWSSGLPHVVIVCCQAAVKSQHAAILLSYGVAKESSGSQQADVIRLLPGSVHVSISFFIP